MTVTMHNVDASFFEVLKSLVKLRENVVIQKLDDEVELSPSEAHIKQINAVYDKIPLEEQTFVCNASKAAVWEMIKNDTW
ncbi:MAG: hypothetical protein II973_06425 [Spirochaetaceae bacterium]|nr:hypothetical protein [Spirochaetaceae bacterium]